MIIFKMYANDLLVIRYFFIFPTLRYTVGDKRSSLIID